MTPTWAAIRVFRATRRDVVFALDRVMAREGRIPFEVDRIPPEYPAERGEFESVLIEAHDACEAVTVRLAAWRTAFARALALSKTLVACRLAAAVLPPTEPLRLKAYAGGDLVLAVGSDPDDELFFRPPRADLSGVARLLTSWGLPSCDSAEPEAVWRTFAPDFVPALPDRATPESRCYARQSSRLVRMS